MILYTKAAEGKGEGIPAQGTAGGEESRTENDSLVIRQGSTRRLLLQFVHPDGTDSERESAQRIKEVVRELGLQPAVVERIEQAITGALAEARQREMCEQQGSAISIQVWVSAPSATGPLRPGSDTQGVRIQKRSGWGFFLLQRTEGDPRTPEIESPRVIELCLYQESTTVTREATAKGLSGQKNDATVKGE